MITTWRTITVCENDRKENETVESKKMIAGGKIYRWKHEAEMDMGVHDKSRRSRSSAKVPFIFVFLYKKKLRKEKSDSTKHYYNEAKTKNMGNTMTTD